MKFKRQWDPEYKGTKGEVNTMPSMTVPDQTISLKQLLKNHTRGIPTNARLVPGEYLGVEMPRIEDLTDIAENRERLEEINSQLQNDIDDYNDKKRQQAAKNDTVGTVGQ